MSDTPTPRTDSFYDSFDEGEDNDGRIIDETFSFARQLERELAKEKERAEKFKWQVHDTYARAEKAEAALAERDAEIAKQDTIIRARVAELNACNNLLRIIHACGFFRAEVANLIDVTREGK